MNKIIINKTISPSWDIVHEILDQIKESISIDHSNLIDATTTVVNELLENALKYGKFIPENPEYNISLHIEIDETIIKILISNYVADKKNLDQFTSHIDRINETDNPKDLYIERLKELAKGNNFEESQLGLFKIGYESKFYLEYKFENDILTIVATRKLS